MLGESSNPPEARQRLQSVRADVATAGRTMLRISTAAVRAATGAPPAIQLRVTRAVGGVLSLMDMQATLPEVLVSAPERLPEGVTEKGPQGGFWQKNTPSYYPAFIRRVNFPTVDEKKPVHYAIVEDLRSLLYLANQNVLTVSPDSTR